MLNSAIGKLYRHLQLNQKEQEVTPTEITFKEPTMQKENMNILALSQVQADESFHDIVLKLRNFEKEFQRQKVQQHRELMRYKPININNKYATALIIKKSSEKNNK